MPHTLLFTLNGKPVTLLEVLRAMQVQLTINNGALSRDG